METNVADVGSQKGLVDELVEGRDLTKQLYSILLKESSSSSSTNNEAPSLDVTQKILTKIERSLAILRYDELPMVQSQSITMETTMDSPFSFNGTPISPTDSEGEFKDPIDSKEDSRKRKVIPRWTIKVEGCCKSGLEGPIDDGFSWRKYGQKDILGAKYPRAYYRCTQRGQGCLATKQVQRSDDDPTYFEVTYRGKHTCYQSSSSSSSTLPHTTPKPEPNIAAPFPPSQEILWSFETDPKDIKPILNPYNNNHIRSYSFPPHFSSTHKLGATQFTPNNNTNISDYNNNFNDYSKNTINTQGASSLELANTNALEIGSDFSFDQGELDHEFLFASPHLFQ